MDVFVQNLFDGIDIPDDLSEVGRINTTAPKHEKNPTQDENRHMGQPAQRHQAQIQDNANACQTTKVAPVITAGLPVLAHDGGFARPTKRPIFDVKAPFIAPKPCPTPSQPAAVPTRRLVEKPENTKREETCTSTNGRKLSHAVKKTIAERFPLRGPAGIRSYRSLVDIMLYGESAKDAAGREKHAWVKALDMLDSNSKLKPFQQTNFIIHSPGMQLQEHFSVSEYVTKKYNIKWIINEASIRHVGFKMDWLVVFVLSQRTLGLQVMYAFMDKTGQMLGCMKEELHSNLKTVEPGCTLILKNVSCRGEI
ncbi:hypothetical protein BBBOND_0302010 [Babesia bigemina]|uniref:Uncharacterized protein n=1 Tax=Babesia bigemina TaxID=5866 RepID=A0A061D8N3_BABBI|nr:hypothetical protein BBBOND_0302010 [Babesia bigemina]CDR96297.1 hypothetical protein BBBOND_0302010 [Babesia bigemina]|eukprot:XP_012768483.1 hypothetical protein BBBOND_0302010 [Babesia bigemina]